MDWSRFSWFGLAVLVGSGGCFADADPQDDGEEVYDDGNDDDSSSPPPAPPPPPDGVHIDFDGCEGNATQAEVNDTVVLASDFGDSLHEMVACGGLNVALCTSVVTGIVNAIWQGLDDATPASWTYAGDGVYATSGAMADMTTEFYLTESFSFGEVGDRLTENLFRVDTYLVNPRVVVTDWWTGDAELRFDAAGPYVELLGFPADVQSPIDVDANDLNRIGAGLGALEFESSFIVEDLRAVSTIRYHVKTDRMPASALVGGAPMNIAIDTADGRRAGLGQALTVDAWGVEFVSGNVGALEGAIDFHVQGRHFPYQGQIVFDASKYGEIFLECP